MPFAEIGTFWNIRDSNRDFPEREGLLLNGAQMGISRSTTWDTVVPFT